MKLELTLKPLGVAGTWSNEGLNSESVKHPHLLASCLPGLWEGDERTCQRHTERPHFGTEPDLPARL